MVARRIIINAALSITFAPGFLANETGTGGCQPHTWGNGPSDPTPISSLGPRIPDATPSVPKRKNIQAGDVNCRYEARTYDEIDSSSCQQLADDYGVNIDKFYELNPILAPDCGRIRPNTEYCVRGFIEPLRAYDGFCGPFYNNATCLYTGKECCNRETWTCGNRGRDCTPSLCYKDAGSCQLRIVESTDGICGLVESRHTFRTCGKWGDCCNIKGKCGSGPEFCGKGKCQEGQCSDHDWPMDENPPPLPWEFGEGLP